MKDYNEADCLKSLGRKISKQGRVITVEPNSLGIGLMGKLDYLNNHAGYVVRWQKRQKRARA